MLKLTSEHRGVDKVKLLIVKQLELFFKDPRQYQFIAQADFTGIKVRTEFPYKSGHLPLIAVSETSEVAQFVDIRAANFIRILDDPETGDIIGKRYGGANSLSLNVDIATLVVPQRQQLIDLVMMWFQILARDSLNYQGIQVTAVRLGSTSEVPQDQEPNMVYVANVGVELWIDWYLDVPVEVLERVNIQQEEQIC